MNDKIMLLLFQDRGWRLANGSLDFSLFYKDSLTYR